MAQRQSLPVSERTKSLISSHFTQWVALQRIPENTQSEEAAANTIRMEMARIERQLRKLGVEDEDLPKWGSHDLPLRRSH